MATSFLTPFLRQRVTAQAAGISIVRNILKREEFPNGFTTKQLYRLAVKEPAPQGFQPYPLAPPTQPAQPKRSSKGKNTRKPVVGGVSDVYPPHPDHPIRSVKFLKAHILPNLEGNLEIKMIRQPKSTAKPAEEVEVPTTKRERKQLASSQAEFVWKVLGPGDLPNPPRPKPEKVIVGTEVGVGVDASHLNKRRQRARVAKIGQSVFQMKDYQHRLEERAKGPEVFGGLSLHPTHRKPTSGNFKLKPKRR